MRVRASGSEPAGGDRRVRASGSEPAGGDRRVRASGSEPAGGDQTVPRVTDPRATVHESPAPEAAATRSPRSLRWVLMLVLIATAAIVAVVLSAGLGRDPTVVQSVLLDRPAPPLAGPTLGGGRFDLADHRGEVVLVNVWASWCAPCRREYPVLEEANEALGPRGLQVVGINTQDTEAEAQKFLDELGGANFPSVLDPDGRIAVEWGTFGVPETFVVDRDGRLRAKVVGAVTREWIADNVVSLLDQP